ncbi:MULTISPECIES: rolling circle replication-associated protein [Delftia]|uniref:Replication-associated protein ORF2/G2P domain-containing protein n=1 Tax=Delftia deserti TaxID=1651218 RepID=A0ABW5EIG2_9BURK
MSEFRFNEDTRPAFQPWQQSARMGGAVEAWRARSVASAQALADAQGEKARSAGLVSLSTTCKGVSVVDFFTENTIEIDNQKTRLTRMRKALGVSAKCLHNQGPKNQRVWMLTLTYAGTNRDWRPEHISRFLDGLRKWHYSRTGEKKVRYAWVAELQRRGVIHYHVVVWLDAGLTPPKPDRAWRARGVWQAPMWGHGMSNRVEAYAPVAYLMKYATKDVSKIQGGFPHGARIHGAGGLDESGRGCRRWVLWPAYVQGNAAITDRFRPSKGGGYVNAETGELLLPEFAPTGGGFSRFVRIRHTPRRIEAHGPFMWIGGAGAEGPRLRGGTAPAP